MTTPRVDLRKFCSTDETRPTLMAPWRDGEFTYAGDGRIVLKVPSEPEDAVNPNAPKRELVERIFAAFTAFSPSAPNTPQITWQKLPELPVLETQDCDDCKGGGNHECECGDVHKCRNCEGAGQIPIDGYLDIWPARFNCYYLRLIAELPNLEIAIRGELDPMMLRFDGGVGVLMPMRKDVPWAERAST